MSWVIGFLTVVLVLDCLFLVLLVLIQLPKKESGLGQAFGSSTTDALFGAGSGTVLTKLTKYAAGVFFGLTFLLSILNSAQARNRGIDPRAFLKGEKEPAAEAAPTPGPAAATAPPPGSTNLPAVTTPQPLLTNLLLTTPANLPAPANTTSQPATNQ